MLLGLLFKILPRGLGVKLSVTDREVRIYKKMDLNGVGFYLLIECVDAVYLCS